MFRRFARLVLRVLLPLVAKVEVRGLENCPPGGPLIVAINHLAHMDAPLVLGTLPWEMEAIALSDLYQVPVTGQLLRLYGAIPIHRDQFDREVLRRALQVLAEGKVLVLAPEARMSVTGALEKGRRGVAWLADRSGAPILPVALTGTEKAYAEWKRLRRPRFTVTVGKPFTPDAFARGSNEGSRPCEEAYALPRANASPPPCQGRGAERRQHLARVTDEIMRRIAELLPPEYRGVYV